LAEKNAEPGGGSPRIRTSSPIGVTVSNEVMGGGAVELQTEVRCSSEIAEHSLDKLKVRC
jgi:hypothetical protein